MVLTILAVGDDQATIDAVEVHRALSLLVDPDHHVELRSLPVSQSRVRHGSDLDQLVSDAGALSHHAKGVYFCLNPVKPPPLSGRGGSAEDRDALWRRWFLVDIDPVRPDKTNATAGEKQAARELASEVLSWLLENEWPAPIIVDSGNGWHLLFRIDLPNDEHSRALLRTTLNVLAKRFDSDLARIDRKVHNAARISKLPGTWARKGPYSEDRPHRLARLDHVPEAIVPVTIEQLDRIANLGRKKDEKPGKTIRANNGPDRVSLWATTAKARELASLALAPIGDRNNALNKAAFVLGTLVGAGVLRESDVVRDLHDVASRIGLEESEINGTIRSGMESGKAEPREIPAYLRENAPDARTKKEKEKQKAEKTDEPIPEGESVITWASEIKPQKVQWLWPRRIPRGKLTTFAGVGGLGKTFVLLDITARVTRGDGWPDCPADCREPGKVLFISGEDDPDDTLVPRLIELGADRSRVAFLTTRAQGKFSLGDLALLNRAMGDMGQDVQLVVIDPPTAYLGGVDDHKNAELRGLLSPLADWAKLHNVALVFNTHVNKPQGKVEAMMRVMGSVAWVNAVRAAHMFARDPDDETRERRLFCGMKLNIGKETRAMAYRILATSEDMAKVEWLGEVDTTADAALNGKVPKRRKVEACDWLEEIFGEEIELPSKTIFKLQKEQTMLSDDAVREAKEAMGIRASQKISPEPGGGRAWWWIWSLTARQEWARTKTQKTDEVEL